MHGSIVADGRASRDRLSEPGLRGWRKTIDLDRSNVLSYDISQTNYQMGSEETGMKTKMLFILVGVFVLAACSSLRLTSLQKQMQISGM